VAVEVAVEVVVVVVMEVETSMTHLFDTHDKYV